MFKQKINESAVLRFGFLSGVAEAAYCLLIGFLFSLLEQLKIEPPQVVGQLFFLLLLVFSAGISGLIVFGYPLYLAFQRRFAEALMTVAITLATLLIIGILVLMILM